MSVDVVVIDDGSAVGTAKLAAEAGAKVVSFGRNRELGAVFSQARQRFGKCCQELTWAASALKKDMLKDMLEM